MMTLVFVCSRECLLRQLVCVEGCLLRQLVCVEGCLLKTAGVCRRVLANFVRLMSLQLTFAFQQPLLFDLTAL
jgi:hypothetical protein